MSTVFVVGATGVLGTALIPRLVAAGHQARALSRSPEHDAAIRALGAEPVRADLFDPASLRAAMAGTDAAFHLATRIPPTAKATKRAMWVDNDRVRAEGARNVVDAALAADVGAVIYPGFALVYPDGGDRWLDAATTPAQPPDILRSSLAAEAEIARFAATPGRRGIVLRLGSLYGPGLASAADLLAVARRGVAPLFGRNGAYLPTLWIDDAATALLAALERVPSGVYDVVDDEPLTQDELRQALAAAVGRRRPLRPPVAIARLLLGAVAEPFLRSQRVSNRRFRAAADWSPSVSSARAGMALLADPPARDDRPGRRRALLAVGALALFFLAAGAWQQFAPRSFYDLFPGFGMS